jgi:hypothetical protein
VAEAVADMDTSELRRQLEAAEDKARQNYENWARATARARTSAAAPRKTWPRPTSSRSKASPNTCCP